MNMDTSISGNIYQFSTNLSHPFSPSTPSGSAQSSSASSPPPLTSNPAELKHYCLTRLSEIREINTKSHTPSAFSCIFSFIGFLSTISANAQPNNRDDKRHYMDFIRDYILKMRCVARVSSLAAGLVANPVDWTWGKILYELGRCGLVHNMNLGKSGGPTNQIDCKLTHDSLCNKYGADYVKHQLSLNNGILVHANEKVEFILNAFDLCNAVKVGILRMFNNPTICQTIRHGDLKIGPVIQLISARAHP